MLGLFFSVLTSSSGPALSLGMGYIVVELILVGVLSNLFDWFGTVSDYMLGPNVAAWMVDEGARVTVGDATLIGSAGAGLPSPLHGFLVVTAYIVILSP